MAGFEEREKKKKKMKKKKEETEKAKKKNTLSWPRFEPMDSATRAESSNH